MSNIEPEVPINYEAIADQHIAALQALHDATMAQLGGGLFIGPVSRRKLISSAVLPDKFFRAVATALEEDDVLGSVSPQGAGKLRNVIPQSAALRKVRDFHQFLARSYSETDTVRRSTAGDDALRIYNVAKSFNRLRDNQEFVPRLKAMQEALGPRGRRSASVKNAKKKKDAATAVNSKDDDAGVTRTKTK
jgi:hypothetical protein